MTTENLTPRQQTLEAAIQDMERKMTMAVAHTILDILPQLKKECGDGAGMMALSLTACTLATVWVDMSLASLKHSVPEEKVIDMTRSILIDSLEEVLVYRLKDTEAGA